MGSGLVSTDQKRVMAGMYEVACNLTTCRVFVLTDDVGSVVGYVTVDADSANLEMIYVDFNTRRQGVGTRLLNAVAEYVPGLVFDSCRTEDGDAFLRSVGPVLGVAVPVWTEEPDGRWVLSATRRMMLTLSPVLTTDVLADITSYGTSV